MDYLVYHKQDFLQFKNISWAGICSVVSVHIYIYTLLSYEVQLHNSLCECNSHVDLVSNPFTTRFAGLKRANRSRVSHVGLALGDSRLVITLPT